MPSKRKVSIVIPALNEEESIGRVIDSIPVDVLRKMGFDVEVLVVDGASEDRTREIAVRKGAKVVVEPRRGYGRAYMIGFKHVDGDIIVTGDADGTYPFKIIPHVIKLMEKYNLDFVTTNRFARFEDGAWPPIHLVGNRLLTFLFMLLFGIFVRDSQSGMWFIRRSLLNGDSRFMGYGMEFSAEIKIDMIRQARKWLEIPISYKRRKTGKTKVRWFRDGIYILAFLIKKRVLDLIRRMKGR
ncbi:glycosyltransferase family 2 protein [Candidatus Pacearchaeota archaeon]|nr:MAG: glycosyltransferase family 2 protein [Candidatus Pacearchaeota archaeon]